MFYYVITQVFVDESVTMKSIIGDINCDSLHEHHDINTTNWRISTDFKYNYK